MARSAVPLDTRSTPPAAPGEAGHGSLHARVMRLRGPKDLETTRIVSAARARRARTSTPRRRRVDGAAGAAPSTIDEIGPTRQRASTLRLFDRYRRDHARGRDKSRARSRRPQHQRDGRCDQAAEEEDPCHLPQSLAQFTALLRSERLSDPRHRARAQIAVSSVSRGALPPPKRKTSGRGRARRSAPVLTASPRHSAANALKPASHHC